jgi:hypothetical protein
MGARPGRGSLLMKAETSKVTMDRYAAFRSLMVERRLVDLDALLGFDDIKDWPTTRMVSTLRYSFVARRELPTWRPLADAVVAEMVSRG